MPKATARRDLAYGPMPQHSLDIYSPAAAACDRPAVLLLHGGAWQRGDKAGSAPIARAYAAAGFVAFAVNYRLIDGTPGTIWPAQLSDVQLAVRWIKTHAGEFGVDPSRMAARGASAGGHLAALLATLHQTQPGDMSGLLPGVPPTVACAITISGPVDLAALATPGHKGIAALLGTTDPPALAARAATASPLSHVDAHTRPTLIMHGLSDPLIPFSQAETYYEALRRAGAPVWFVGYQGRHMLQGLTTRTRRTLASIQIAFARDLTLDRPSRWTLPAES